MWRMAATPPRRHGQVDDRDVGVAPGHQVGSLLDVGRLPADGEHPTHSRPRSRGEALRERFVVIDVTTTILRGSIAAMLTRALGSPGDEVARWHGGSVIDGDDYGLARTVVAVRTAVVISIGLLLVIGPDWVRRHTAASAAVLTAAMLYSLVLLANPRPEIRRTRYAWGVSLVDGGFTLTLIALTGGCTARSPRCLSLAVIASAARMSFRETSCSPRSWGWVIWPLALRSPRTGRRRQSLASSRVDGAVSDLRRHR